MNHQTEALKLALEVNESMKDVLKQVNELISENKALKEALADHIEDNLVMVTKGDAWRKQLSSAQRNELKQIEDGTWEADRNG